MLRKRFADFRAGQDASLLAGHDQTIQMLFAFDVIHALSCGS